MDIRGLFIFDPIVKRARRMSFIQKELLCLSEDRQSLEKQALLLTKQYESLKQEIKNLKKTGTTS